MKAAITITVRMKSERLPLKVLRYIKGRPMIEHQIDRLKLSKNADGIILCTSTNPQDDVLIDVAEKEGIKWFRGSEDDVLDRLFNAAKKYKASHIVSVTADNPLVDPAYIDRIITSFRESDADFITCKNLPLGAFSYGIKIDALKKIIETKKEKDTEIWGNLFERESSLKKIDLEVEEELRHPEIRLTVDFSEDLELVRRIFDSLGDKNIFPLKSIIKLLLENPKLMEINRNIIQRHK
ncbi:NTP transferase domain-containing protein [Candidatus Woesearchaeota archaeon]|nr:NTP transferase domain-containing protein [Candidatus Woesearchaeota archaeon]